MAMGTNFKKCSALTTAIFHACNAYPSLNKERYLGTAGVAGRWLWWMACVQSPRM